MCDTNSKMKLIPQIMIKLEYILFQTRILSQLCQIWWTMDQMILANLADMTNVVSDVAGEESELPGEINDVMQVMEPFLTFNAQFGDLVVEL